MSQNSLPLQSRFNDAKETTQTLKEMANLLGVDLDMETLAICIRLCEAGVDPQILAVIVNKLQQASKQTDTKNGTNET